jgi:hypothetical protein
MQKENANYTKAACGKEQNSEADKTQLSFALLRDATALTDRTLSVR